MLITVPYVATIHAGDSGAEVQFSFDTDKPIPWLMDVLLVWCHDCYPNEADHNLEAHAGLLEGIKGRLRKSADTHRANRIAAGAKMLTLESVAAVLLRERTWIQEQINAGRFPEAMYSGNKRVWLEEEVRHAAARIVCEDTAKASERNHENRHRPLNRHERRKAAKG